MPKINIDLTTLSGWSSLLAGTHAITIKAKAAGYLDSEASEAVTVVKPYSIQATTVNVSADSSNPITILQGDTAILTYTANSGYVLPSTVSINGVNVGSSPVATGVCTASWISSTGTLNLSYPTDDIHVTITGTAATLSAPTISVSGDVMTIVDNSGEAVSYDIYIDGVYVTNVTKSPI